MDRLVLPAVAGDAERAVMAGVTSWADESRFDLVSVRPRVRDIGPKKRPLLEVRVSGTGSLAAVAGFIHRIESASLALAIEDLEISSPREGADRLTLSLRLTGLLSETEAPAKTEQRS